MQAASELSLTITCIQPILSSMADSGESSASVGARCVCDGFYATIRFIGEVPPTKGKATAKFYVGAS